AVTPSAHLPSQTRRRCSLCRCSLSSLQTPNPSAPLPFSCRPVTQPPGDSISSLCFSPKANFVVATSWDN
ncbi:hypothetical protein HN51_028335, partial [Arachis hypogaea]